MKIALNETGASLYVRFDDDDDTAVDMTEGASLKTTVYEAADAAIESAGLEAGTYIARIFRGTASGQDAGDELIAVQQRFVWTGNMEISVITRVDDIGQAGATTIANEIIELGLASQADLNTALTALSTALNALAALSDDVENVQESVDNIDITPGGTSGGGILRGRISAPNLAPREFLEVVQGESRVLTFIVEAEGRFNNASATAIEVKFEDARGNVVTIEDDDVERVCEELDVQIIRAVLTAEDSESLVVGLTKVQISFDTQRTVITNSLKIVEGI